LDREELISLSEAAAEFGFSTGHLRFLLINEVIAGRKIGRYWVVTRMAVAEYAKDNFKRSRNPRKYQG
jgi:hypothetical protein